MAIAEDSWRDASTRDAHQLGTCGGGRQAGHHRGDAQKLDPLSVSGYVQHAAMG